MTSERQTLTARRDELLGKINAAGRWTPDQYDEVLDLEKRISGLPDDQPELLLRPPKKGR